MPLCCAVLVETVLLQYAQHYFVTNLNASLQYVHTIEVTIVVCAMNVILLLFTCRAYVRLYLTRPNHVVNKD